ncbi:MAG: hypothetical protein MRY63_07130 [Neomegalonema sp.]|nr:hypothetical protein [Neomegalonema sp.]
MGGAGADYLNGGEGFDIASYEDAADGVVADLSRQLANTGDAAGDTFYTIEGLAGSSFDDQLYGDDKDNLLSGDDGDDTLSGEEGDDTLLGGRGDDTLLGGDGDDVFIGGEGADRLQGGKGVDTADYSSAVENISIDLPDNSATGGRTRRHL